MVKSKAKSTSQQCEFSFFAQELLIGCFDAGDISGFGGAVIIRQLEQVHGLIAGAAACIRDLREQSKVKHSIFTILLQRVILICLGYPDAIDSNKFRADSMMKLILGILPTDKAKSGPSQSTVARMESGRKKSKQKLKQERKAAKTKQAKESIKDKEKGVTENDIRRLFRYYIERYIQKHKQPPKMVVLDFDGSAVEAFGQQQYIAFNGHYGHNMYFPLFVFDQNGWLLAPILRPGTETEAKAALPVLRTIVKRLRKAWPGTTIVFRADAAFHSPELFLWCENNAVFYVCGLKGDNNLNNGSKQTDKKSERSFERSFGTALYLGRGGGSKRVAALREAHKLPKEKRKEKLSQLNAREVRLYKEFWHQAGSASNEGWDRERRVIGRSVFNDRGLKRRYIVTNLDKYHAKHIYEEIYARRGRMEQMIRSMKELGCGYMSCEEFLANQFRLLLFGLAYNLFQLLRDELPKPVQKQKEITLMETLLHIPVQIKVTTRQIWLRWSSSYPHQRLFLGVYSRLNALIEAG